MGTFSIASILLSVGILSLLSISNAQVSGNARLQPHPLEAPSAGSCCALVNDDDNVDAAAYDLLMCANTSSSVQATFGPSVSSSEHTNKPKPKVALLTYMSPEKDISRHFAVPDILEYGAYHAVSMAVYAEHNNMMYRIATEDVGGNNEPADVRWNKVKLLMDALDEDKNGWAKDTEYIVWVDADAIVLDMGLSIEAVGRQFPNAHFMASADIRQGYINSGFLVLRNTPWLRTFLKDWWEISDRARVCDQDAFDAVYTRYTVLEREARKQGTGTATSNSRIEERVRILRRDALNSDPPATLRQKTNNQVLHLMGESTSMRRKVFREAFKAMCLTMQQPSNDDDGDDNDDQEYLPAQLGLTQERLYDTALEIYRNEADDRQQSLVSLLGSVRFPISDDSDAAMDASLAVIKEAPSRFEGLGRSAHHLCDLLQHGRGGIGSDYEGVDSSSNSNAVTRSPKEVLLSRRELFELAIHWLEGTSAFLNGVNSKIQASQASIARLQEEGGDVEGKPFDPSSVADVAVLKRRLSTGLEAFLQLLKRGAEAGNDLFGALTEHSHFEVGEDDDEEEDEEGKGGGVRERKRVTREHDWARQKLLVAERVFALLRELDARVGEESKHVPRHMRALMHQNVAYLQYTMSDLFRLVGNTDTDTAAETDLLKRQQQQQLRDFHLYQAEQHALSSVYVFDSTFGDLHQADRSTNEEHALSLQILAAIYCTDGRNLTLGMQTWDRTVAKARDNLQGVSLGKPLERLADVYHNAAVCHLHSAQATHGQGQKGGARLFERALALVQKAIEARERLHDARAVPVSVRPPVPAHRPTEYTASNDGDDGDDGGGGGERTGGRRSNSNSNIDEVGSEDERRMLALSLDLQENIKRKYALWRDSSRDGTTTSSSSSGGNSGSNAHLQNHQQELDLESMRYLSELDEEEWEECEAGEEGCEAFIVDTAAAEAHDTTPQQVDEEEDEEIGDARKRYAAQSAFLL